MHLLPHPLCPTYTNSPPNALYPSVYLVLRFLSVHVLCLPRFFCSLFGSLVARKSLRFGKFITLSIRYTVIILYHDLFIVGYLLFLILCRATPVASKMCVQIPCHLVPFVPMSFVLHLHNPFVSEQTHLPSEIQ